MNSSFIQRLKTGEVFPDQLLGWSSKTILAGLLALMILKLKSVKKKGQS